MVEITGGFFLAIRDLAAIDAGSASKPTAVSSSLSLTRLSSVASEVRLGLIPGFLLSGWMGFRPPECYLAKSLLTQCFETPNFCAASDELRLSWTTESTMTLDFDIPNIRWELSPASLGNYVSTQVGTLSWLMTPPSPRFFSSAVSS